MLLPLFLFLLLVSANALAQGYSNHLLQKLDQASDYVMVVAHRGDWREAPENSLQAYENCIRMGVDMLEIDIQRTSDGVLVVMHDEYVDRTTDGSGKISNLTFAKIQQLGLKSMHAAWVTRHKVPTLEEVLNLAKGRILINIDKGYDYYDQVFELAEKTGTTQQIVIKSSNSAAKVLADHPKIMEQITYMPVVTLSSSDAPSNIASQLELKPKMMECCFDTYNSQVENLLKTIQDHGVKVFVNTLWPNLCAGHDDDRAVEMEQADQAWGWVLEQGTRLVQTDRPRQLLQYLRDKHLHDGITHTYKDGKCIQCGEPDPSYYTPASDGYYELATLEDFTWFCNIVKCNTLPQIKVRLTDDIDLSKTDFDAIGGHSSISSCNFSGEFDGQGHTISGLNFTVQQNNSGLFGVLKGKVCNLVLKGTMSVPNQVSCVGSLAGCLEGGVVENVSSMVSIQCTGTGLSHVGGLIGEARNGSVVSCCTYSGSLSTGNSDDCFGGIVGYGNDVVIRNCHFAGRLSTPNSQTGKFYAGILGYCNTTQIEIINCLSSGMVRATNGSAIVGSMRSQVPNVYYNNYYRRSYATNAYGSDVAMPTVKSETHVVSLAELQSGEVACLLNGDQEEICWYQTLGEDDTPVLDSTHLQVYSSQLHCDGTPYGTYSNTDNGTVRDVHDYREGKCTYCGEQMPDFASY